jgi:hypothetical protein
VCKDNNFLGMDYTDYTDFLLSLQQKNKNEVIKVGVYRLW